MVFARKPVGFQHSNVPYHNNTFPLSIINNVDFKIGHSTGCLKRQEVSTETKSNKHQCPAWRDNHDNITTCRRY